MNPKELIEGAEYKCRMPYDKETEIWKCISANFNEHRNTWGAKFEIMTDPYKCNRIGKTENMNEIEIERYIYPI